MKQTIDKMFGFIWKQPIHKTFVQMRLISVGLILFCLYLLHDMWFWFKNQNELPDGWDVAFWGFAGAVLGIVWKAIQHIQDKHHDHSVLDE